jgi:peptidyl-prolyl cis-trans isomerase A (cyclophilin A)
MDVDAGVFDGSSIFRIVRPGQHPAEPSPIEVVQMGHRSADEKLAPSIRHESTRMSGLSHRRGTVSLARFAPGAVYHSFFVCMRDEPGLDAGGSRHGDGQGFAAFGHVTRGFERLEQLLRGWDGDEQYLRHPVPIRRAHRVGG